MTDLSPAIGLAGDARTLLDAGAASVHPEQFQASDPSVPDVLAAVVPDGYRLATADIAAQLIGYREAPRREDVLDAAWRALIAELGETLPVPVLAGQAPSYR